MSHFDVGYCVMLPFDAAEYPGIYIAPRDRIEFLALANRDLRDLCRFSMGRELLGLISKRTQSVGTSPSEDLDGQEMRCIITWNTKDLEQADSSPLSHWKLRKKNDEWQRIPQDKLINERDKRSGLGPDHTTSLQEDAKFSHKPDPAEGGDLTSGVRNYDFDDDRRNTSDFRRPVKGFSSLTVYSPWHDYSGIVGQQTPGFVALAHELFHSLHHLSGDTNTNARFTDGPDSWDLHEEARTIGLGIYTGMRMCENALRREVGLPERTYYANAGDTDFLTSAISGPPFAPPGPPPGN